jgi:hypothetical protein
VKRFHLKMASSGSTVLEYLPHHLMVEGLSLALATCTVSEKSVKRFHLKMANSGSTVVEHSPHHMMVDDLSLTAAACTGVRKL